MSTVATRKNETKLSKTEKNMEKENKTDESDFSEKQIPYLNSLEPSEFEPRTNIRLISSSNSDDKEEGAKYKVKRYMIVSGANAMQNQWLADVLQRPATLLKRDSNTCIFL